MIGHLYTLFFVAATEPQPEPTEIPSTGIGGMGAGGNPSRRIAANMAAHKQTQHNNSVACSCVMMLAISGALD